MILSLNQFIFNYQRYSISEVESFMGSENGCVVSVSLKDKLSDSGIIGVVFVTKNSGVGLLEECFVSCRALGRGIDDAIVLGSIKAALDYLHVSKLKVNFTEGERNLPAKEFVNSKLGSYISGEGEFDFDFPTKLININIL